LALARPVGHHFISVSKTDCAPGFLLLFSRRAASPNPTINGPEVSLVANHALDSAETSRRYRWSFILRRRAMSAPMPLVRIACGQKGREDRSDDLEGRQRLCRILEQHLRATRHRGHAVSPSSRRGATEHRSRCLHALLTPAMCHRGVHRPDDPELAISLVNGNDCEFESQRL